MTEPNYGEPWWIDGSGIYEDGNPLDGGQLIADWYPHDENTDRTDGQRARAVACVNALAGYDPGAVRDLLESCKAWVTSKGGGYVTLRLDSFPEVKDAIAKAKEPHHGPARGEDSNPQPVAAEERKIDHIPK